MIRFVVGKMNFENVKFFINGIDEANVLGEFMEKWDASKADSLGAITEIKVKGIAPFEDGFVTSGNFGFIESMEDLTLAGGKLIAYAFLHLKFLVFG